MCHAPQFRRYDHELKERAERELNPAQRYDCDNCGYSRSTDDAISMICPDCSHLLALFYIGPFNPPVSCMI